MYLGKAPSGSSFLLTENSSGRLVREYRSW